MHRVYISASTQKNNVGVGQYGTEQDRMQALADRVKFWLDTQKGKFTVFRNQPGWTLEQTVKDCKSLAVELFIDNHTNAGKVEATAGDGGAEGTETYFHAGSVNGKKIAELVYKYTAPLSPGKDRGVDPDSVLYTNGLYVLRETPCPSCLTEHFFHSNLAEVNDALADMDKYAKAEAKAICEYFGEKWEETLTKEQSVKALADEMVKDGIITDPAGWIEVLMGRKPANPEYLQIAFRRAVGKI